MAVKQDSRLVELLDGRGPGAHLRKVREEANMSVDKVAAALLLNTHTVEAIEADAYERLPAPTFVRGYLRGYARVLGLPSRPFLEMFDRQGFEPPPLTPDATESKQAHTSDTAVRLVTYAVAAVLVILVALWWHSQEDGGFGIGSDLFDRTSDSSPEPSLPADEVAGTPTIGGNEDRETQGTTSDSMDGMDAFRPGIEPLETPPSINAEDATVEAESIGPSESSPSEESAVTAESEPPATGDSASADFEVADTDAEERTGAAATPPSDMPSDEMLANAVDAEGDLTTPGDATSSETAPAETGNEADGNAIGDAEAGAAQADPNSNDSLRDGDVTPTAESEAAGSGLVLEFAHESWVEVYDGERTRLFFGLVQAGRVLTFDEVQPFDVLLGFAEDIRVTINGRAFDHTPHLKHGVARFSVGTQTTGSLPSERGN